MDYRYGVFMAFGIPFLIVVTCWVAYVCGKRSVLRRKKKLSDEQRKTIMQTVFRIADFDESGEVDEMGLFGERARAGTREVLICHVPTLLFWESA